MPKICFYFQVHQPYRVRRYRVFDIGNSSNYFNANDDSNLNNEKIFHKVAQKCYLPTNRTILELLKKYPDFKVSYSLSGVFIEQMEEFSDEVLQSFKDLVATGQVEMLDETYYHSLSFLYSKEEFRSQVKLHRQKVQDVFGVTPKVFRNTELIYNNELAKEIESLGYIGILAEGVDRILGWRNPNFVYKPVNCEKIRLLLKNYKLSDDIAFRFSSKEWNEWPLTVEKYMHWVNAVNGNGEIINLFMDYETFGEHQWEDTGIFEFLKALPGEVLKNPDNGFVTPSEAIQKYPVRDEVDVHNFISWADTERDLSAWLSNSIQHDAIRKIYDLESVVKQTKDPQLIHDWRKLQTSDHFYYMCTKWFNDGDVHKYFNPYESPYDAFIAYMNVINDLKIRLGIHTENSKTSPNDRRKFRGMRNLISKFAW